MRTVIGGPKSDSGRDVLLFQEITAAMMSRFGHEYRLRETFFNNAAIFMLSSIHIQSGEPLTTPSSSGWQPPAAPNQQQPQLGWQQHPPTPRVWSQQPSQPARQQSPPPVKPPKRGLRKMSWFILVVQALFVVWIIAGINSVAQGTCDGLDAETCNAAKGIGATLGTGMILVFWVIVDVILLVIWAVTKPRQR